MRRFFRFYPLSILVVAIVLVLCLMPIEDPPLKDVRFIDKWTHLLLFGGVCAVFCLELGINVGRQGLWLAPIMATLLGGLVELLQAYLTTYRSGEWLDFAADTLGALIVYGRIRWHVAMLK